MKTIGLLLVAAGLALFTSCSRGSKADTEAAVRQALDRYLASRPNLNMQGMDMDVSAIKFSSQKAEADVSFRAKGDAKAAMSIHYTLRRTGDGWEVEPQTSGHGGMMPPQQGGSGELPSGHPPVGSTAPKTPELPPGHPTVKKQ